MKGNLAGLAMAVLAAFGLVLGGCVADAGDEEEEAAVATSPAPLAPGQTPLAPGLQPQDANCTGPGCEPEPNPWNGDDGTGTATTMVTGGSGAASGPNLSPTATRAGSAIPPATRK